MKKFSWSLILLAALAFAGCNNHNAAKQEEKNDAGNKSLNVKVSELATTQDLICGMKLDNGAVADTAVYQGKTYGFCSSECKAEFLKDPQAHLSQK